VDRNARIYFTASFRASSLTNGHFCLATTAEIAATDLRFFAGRLEDVGNIPPVARLIYHPLLILLVLVLVIERKNRIDHEQEHDHDGGGAPKCAACES
jgi:hypothetical protein